MNQQHFIKTLQVYPLCVYRVKVRKISFIQDYTLPNRLRSRKLGSPRPY